MDPKGQFVFFLLALVCFVASAVWDIEKMKPRTRGSVNLVGLGLAFFDVVFMYNAYKAI
jgi:hypothetical protein